MDWEMHEEEIKKLQEVLGNSNNPASDEYKAALEAIKTLMELQEKSNRLYLDEEQVKTEAETAKKDRIAELIRGGMDFGKTAIYCVSIMLLGKMIIYAEEERIINSAAKSLLNFLRPRV